MIFHFLPETGGQKILENLRFALDPIGTIGSTVCLWQEQMEGIP